MTPDDYTDANTYLKRAQEFTKDLCDSDLIEHHQDCVIVGLMASYFYLSGHSLKHAITLVETAFIAADMLVV